MAMEGVKSVQSVQTAGYKAPQMSTENVAEVELKDVEAVEATKVQETAKGSNEEGKNLAEKDPSDATIKQAIKDINKKMNSTVAEFGFHEGTGRVTIKIKDKTTDKVVKEIPAEKTLDMIEKAWELAGILVDEKR